MPREHTPFVKIRLTQGKVALISPEDAERVATIKWSVRWVNGRWYAQGFVKGERRLVLMHRFVAETPSEKQTDHVNGNGLDNRRGNLREATHGQNMANSRRRIGPSGYRGVVKHGKGWTAQCTDGHGKNRFLGTFGSAEEAAHAYDAAACLVHGAFARLNFPNEVPET